MRMPVYKSRFLTRGEIWLEAFDFGGWYRGTTDQALLKINEFKRGFGGQVVREYDCEQILTLKGWVVLNAARLLEKTKNRFRRHGPSSGERKLATTPSDVGIRSVSPERTSKSTCQRQFKE
jgi:hypothetical protein